MNLDDNGRYIQQLTIALRRLRLRTQLYQTPDRPEDRAAQIIEQVRFLKFMLSCNSKIMINSIYCYSIRMSNGCMLYCYLISILGEI